ncbi:MAG TPA: hypothetical protein VHL34_17040 [Rhizomicrobium sp.]|jgi:hypothetical protein|nr:hypothetical protein [Rhizomicrobium sp.]
MGFGIVSVFKVSERASLADFVYEHEGQSGTFTIDRITRYVMSVNLAQEEQHGHIFLKALHKITQAWERGELPDKVSWAG